MSQNFTKQKYIRSRRLSDKWGFYDAQPLAVRQWLQQFPIDLWPASRQDTSSVLHSTERDYLRGLESVWGPDHPAVQDAKLKVTTRNRKVVEVLNLDDLDLNF